MLLMPQYDHQVHCIYVTVSFGAVVVVTVLDICNRSQQRLSKSRMTWFILQNLINSINGQLLDILDLLIKQQSVLKHLV